jgi:hypothetical protein
LETINPHQEYIDQLAASLTDDSMALIDFDRLQEWLSQIAPLLGQVEQLKSECETLRQDCIGRIGGMMKAVAAAQRSDSNLEGIADQLEALPGMKAEELIRQYRRSSARFRDTFGASFSFVGTGHSDHLRSMDPELYK